MPLILTKSKGTQYFSLTVKVCVDELKQKVINQLMVYGKYEAYT